VPSGQRKRVLCTMADMRELVALNPGLLDPRPETPITRRIADVKMAVRRSVVRSARLPLMAKFYGRIYRAHLWLTREIGKRFAGTCAVYSSSGLATGETNVGISDVDIAIYGDWPDKTQYRLMYIFGTLMFFSPLFDTDSLAQICRLDDLRRFAGTNMMMALMYAKGARQWKVLYGSNVLAELPEISPERFDGCVYMEVRRWWGSFAPLCFGDKVTSRDPIFQNTICFKFVAEVLRAERMLHGGFDTTPRRRLIEEEYATTGDPLLGMLRESAQCQFLEIATDPREQTLAWFFARCERLHEAMKSLPSFATHIPMRMDGPATELIVAAATKLHVDRLVDICHREWPGLRAAHLVPAMAMTSPDSLGLFLEVDEASLPALAQLRRLIAIHTAASSGLPQRLSIFLLLPIGAYKIDARSFIDLFQFTLTAQTAPEVYLSLGQLGFLVRGNSASRARGAAWSRFAQDLMQEELDVRRGAHARFGTSSRSDGLENLRHIWRFLQLLVVERTAREGEVLLATTIPAIRRAWAQHRPDMEVSLLELEGIHGAALEANAPIDWKRAAHLIDLVYRTCGGARVEVIAG
jgi:hypothetical protein